MLVSCLCAVFLAACADTHDLNLVIPVEAQDHVLTLEARGAVYSSQSIPINAPAEMNMPMNINWLLPEFTRVKAGDVVATLEAAQLLRMRDIEQLEIVMQAFAMRNHIVDSGVEGTQIEHETERVEGETLIAETFANFDPRYLSRIEIIDAIGDLDYLAAEGHFYDWQFETHEERTQAGLSKFKTAKDSAEQKLESNERALAATEIKSPADGVFIHARTMWGQKASRGRMIFPGRAIGLLPVEGQIEARLYVPKSDAIGLAVGQSVELRIDTNLNEVIHGKVTRVSPIASPKHSNDPRQYVVVTTNINADDPNEVRIGSFLTATLELIALQNAVVLPYQTIFTEGDETFVYVLNGSRLERRNVEVGFRSATLVELASGLQDGERVSLVEPAGLES